VASTSAALRREAERTFFDEKAKTQKVEYVTAKALTRYSNPGTQFPLEMMFRSAGDLRGRTVLDVGCGDGRNAVILGLLGAEVTGIDISPGAIGLARKRCEVNGVRAEFICSPLEDVVDLGRTFDIVWVDALLHHMLHDLPQTLSLLSRALAPGGKLLIKEPVSLSSWFRRLRLVVGPPPDATPDERPLEKADIAEIRKQFPRLVEHRYYLLGRWRATKFLTAVDAMFLRLPGIRDLASVIVLSSE
jgi:SAM-dependent methyltransferase